mmetsp:Transcript_88981/g.207086  ORF Transcript_88981/g.207086 Transcript_88981/m.207086 type:complete len:154 (+) Transcript_88981:45-506(+)|eukprot:CAMPEP_0171106412 /NCGR_PEP_ID=MMETSP0766_2-20121228/64681_1 /TAXON_ID=439317 /ORGANISM="Gambierdiscus australes, Strain CAWD 149" /LENGTH=153 /DNA_ID=CAMNT_0011567497 /DNA_START=37 /DNA_END=498 /DNA_ORIENTATION=+
MAAARWALFLGAIAPCTLAQDFSADIAFAKAVSVDDVKKEVQAQQKPGLVFVTQPWCGACKSLKGSVNKDANVKKLMDKFVVVHAAEDQGKQWQAPGKDDSYIPRVYFLSPGGEMLDQPGPNGKFAHFFGTADALHNAMKDVLQKHTKDSSEL